MSNPNPAPRRRRRRWTILAIVLLAALGLLAGLPWLIAAGPLRPMVDSGLGRAFAPAQIRFQGLGLSWFGPTRLDQVVILDPKGETVVKAGSVVLDRTLGQLIVHDRGPITLTLEAASLEVTRAEDGTVDLAEALKTVIASPDPGRDVTIRMAGGSIRYRDPFLAEPVVADAFDLTIRVPYAPAPVTWSAKLGRGDTSLECQGDFDLWLSRGGPPGAPELQIGVIGKRWPFAARTAGVEARARLDGTLDFARKRGRWIFNGDARIEGLNARGEILAGDRLALDRFEAGWDLAEGEEGWKIRRLSASSPLGQLRAEGQLNGPDGGGAQRIEGRLDLAEIARQLPHALHLRDGLIVDRGTARVGVDLTSQHGEWTCDVEANVVDLAARAGDRGLTLKDPATFTTRLIRIGGKSRVERLSVRTPFLEASAKGDPADGVVYSGKVDLGGIRDQLGEWIDLDGVTLAGRADFSGEYACQAAGGSGGLSSSFRNRTRGKVRDFLVAGVAPWPIRGSESTLEWSLDGPATEAGVPEGWRRLGLTVRSAGSHGRLELRAGDGPMSLVASAETPWKIGEASRRAAIQLDGAWSADRRVLAIERLLLGFEPIETKPAVPPVRLAIRGKFDSRAGELILGPGPGDASASWSLDPDGLRISGLGRGRDSLRIDGGLSGDFAALDALIADATGRKALGLDGRWSAVVNARGDADGLALAAKFGLVEPPDRPANAEPSRPTAFSLRAHYETQADRLDLSEFTLTSKYGTLDASGRVDQVAGQAVVDLKGNVSPDFAAMTAQLASRVEPGARLVGKARAFRASGPIVGDGSKGWKGLDAELGFDLTAADVYGMKFGPTPVVLRASRGHLTFDPISTTLNEGHIRLEPEVDLEAPGGPIIRLAKNSNVREARINDEVSRRVLAYVAPILDQATRASGLVSVDLDHAEFPIGPGRSRQAKVEGAVLFEDVEFAPGPLASEILGAIGRPGLSLKLDQPVTLTIADGRVNQRGMSIPVGELTRIDLAGWVDFDRNIALNATLPVTPAMLGNNPLLSEIVAGTQVKLPISGTLDRPHVDKDAFAANMQDLGKSLLTRGATRGAMELLMRLARPRDPDAPAPPPRPTPEERRTKRQEKKAIRRGEIPPPGGV